MKLRKSRTVMTLEKKILAAILVVATISIMTALSVQALLDPQRQAENKMDELAAEYYSTYLYPRLIGSRADANEAMEELAVAGVSTTYLRQLLLYNNQAHKDAAEFFENARYSCNTNRTGVRFYPDEPYGPEDFHTEIFWDCQKI